MQNNGPKPIITAITAIILHNFMVQVGFRVLGSRVQGCREFMILVVLGLGAYDSPAI